MTGHRRDPPPPAPARVALAPAATGPHRVDGAWWPRSRALHRELPPLLTELDERWPAVSRVTVHTDMWCHGRATLSLTDRTVHVSHSDRAAARHMICLLSPGLGRCDLLVVPPPTATTAAERLLRAAQRPCASSP